jgi:hypothetical protein
MMTRLIMELEEPSMTVGLVSGLLMGIGGRGEIECI